eukprot:scaffold9314_cov57-Skeletonema_menzelii.AAC.1
MSLLLAPASIILPWGEEKGMQKPRHNRAVARRAEFPLQRLSSEEEVVLSSRELNFVVGVNG